MGNLVFFNKGWYTAIETLYSDDIVKRDHMYRAILEYGFTGEKWWLEDIDADAMLFLIFCEIDTDNNCEDNPGDDDDE